MNNDFSVQKSETTNCMSESAVLPNAPYELIAVPKSLFIFLIQSNYLLSPTIS